MLNDGSWLHPSRLPLGAGWSGRCCASGQPVTPAPAAIRDLCNLGNATACPHLPLDRDWDAVRFAVSVTGMEQITIHYVCERGHAPIENGRLTFDRVREGWINPPADERVRRLADSYLAAYRARMARSDAPAESPL